MTNLIKFSLLLNLFWISTHSLIAQANFTQSIDNPDGISFADEQFIALPEFHDFNNDGLLDLLCTAGDDEFGNYDPIGYFKNLGSSSNPLFDSLVVEGLPVSDYFINPQTFGDLNGDGTLDILKCYADFDFNWKFAFIANQSDTSFDLDTPQIDPFGLDFFTSDFPFLFPQLVDIDADGDLDLALMESSGDFVFPPEYNIFLFENTGSQTEPSFTFRGSVLSRENGIPLILIPTYGDIDNDSDIDIMGIIVTRETLNIISFVENIGTLNNINYGNAVNTPFGLTDTIISDAIIGSTLVDYDIDGDLDFFLAFENEGLQTTRLYLNETVSKEDIRLPANAGIRIFPNPASHRVTIKTETPKNAHILLFDSQGKQQLHKMMRQQNQMILNISQFPSGTYYLHYEDEKIRTAQTILIQK